MTHDPVGGEMRESMTEAEVEITFEGAREKFPQATPRIISDNPPADGQFIARKFKDFIRICGMTNVRPWPSHLH